MQPRFEAEHEPQAVRDIGIAGGKGPVSLMLRKSAGVRLRNRLWKAPVEFQAFDLVRRSMGPVSKYI